MNEHLVERFGRSRRGNRPPPAQQVQVWMLPQQLNVKVREYFTDSKKPVDGGAWLDRPEIPTSAEVLDIEKGGSTSSGEVELNANLTKGEWPSKDVYLGTHYELLREDAVRGLREAVSQVKFTPEAKEEAFNGAIGIYDKVHICRVFPSTRGLAITVTFSLFRIGKKPLWEQSKRLITGSLVVLTPAHDMFKSKAVVATVAARPLAALNQDPPEIDLFIARAEELEVDPATEWVMVEDRGGLYEAHRHTMLALQKMMREPFPLKEHLISTQQTIPTPKYVEERPILDLTTVLHNNKQDTYENIDILRNWPKEAQSNLDKTQLEALERILTKQLAIVQGPPGTGKTFISTEAIRIILANRRSGDPPIILACQTNHAIDQLLNQIAPFEPDFVRLGGRSKDKGVVKARTLYEVRKLTSENALAGCLAPKARIKMRELTEQIKTLLLPLNPDKQPLDAKMLNGLGLLTENQADSLEAGASQWVQAEFGNPNQSPFTIWLGKSLVAVPPKQMPETYGFQYEEADLEFEQIREAEAENVAQDDEEFEGLRGEPINVADNFTCRKPPGKTHAKDMEEAKGALREENMWAIPEPMRPAVYRYLQVEAKYKIRDALREKAKAYNEWAAKRRTGLWEKDETLLKKQKIIGMTTTGFSKYRGLLAALEPKIVLIEEAAETLEAPVTVTCLPSLQQLILVGDHQQLRPHCHVKAHEDGPFYLNVSLFERLVKNKIKPTTLGKQRRMIPEIRRLLYPIYKDKIEDHPSVTDPANRPNVPGMGGVNSLFITHFFPEQRDEQMSVYNAGEADMIVGLVEYLVYNGMSPNEIAVLTFYNGQRKNILSKLRKRESMLGSQFEVKTVDSYQGEQNKVIILSLARSNESGNMGFLNVDNRICVALSRAQQGLYIFGNGLMLYGDKAKNWPGHKTWTKVLDIMSDNKDANPKMVKEKNRLKIEPVNRITTVLPVRCANHGNTTEIKDSEDWEGLYGGCKLPCASKLACGHKCTLPCHPFSHEEVLCHEACGKVLPCGHACCEECGEPCSCKKCSKGRGKTTERSNIQRGGDMEGGDAGSPQLSDSDSWNSFAEMEPARYASAAAAMSTRPSQAKTDSASWDLIDIEAEKMMGELSVSAGNSRSQSQKSSSTEGKPLTEKERKKWTETVGGNKTVGHGRDWSREDSLLD